MMKAYLRFVSLSAALLLLGSQPAGAAETLPVFIYETPQEFFGTADLDGDGRLDIVIVDKDTGKYRPGYQTAPGALTWVDCRPGGIKGVTGFTIGKLIANQTQALAFTSPEGTAINLVEAASPGAPGKPVSIAFSAALGPSSLLAVDASSAAKGGLQDLFVGSIYNSPDQNLGTVLRNDGAEFPKLAETTLAGVVSHPNRLSLKNGESELACMLVNEGASDTFHADNLATGKPVSVASITGLPAGSDYTVGNFRGSPLREFLFYKPGESKLLLRPVEEPASGQLRFGQGDSFDLGSPIKRAVTLSQSAGQKLLVIFGTGEKVGIYNFDGVKAPVSIQTINSTNDLFNSAFGLPEGFLLFSQTAAGKFSARYHTYKPSGNTYVAGVFGSLPSLADNDNMIIPDISARIAATQKPIPESDMKLYTNTIPGTRVRYVMVPIHGGEFTMGSPDTEPDRKPDEGLPHRVKIDPFWMGQCEVTWNEYELFMYPDEEKRTRATVPSDEKGDKLADAVTHPSKPYVEMSFGMGKDGYPAISMTQHAANKYCQWLSAKSGEFYRLPTEAEWEYACRAGTTTTYFFGNDASKLGDYAWYEQNSDFKYQKVGKKKPNPWGLYDMTGNVVEWVLDQYDPDYYKQCAATPISVEPWNKATKPYPHSVRGGSWDDEAKMCRSAARRGSDRSWKMQDPQLPKSIWYFSDAQWVGFRIIRPLKVPSVDQMQKYWTSGVEHD
jgi:formylglycine-generating enzyme required for sulfatase activity